MNIRPDERLLLIFQRGRCVSTPTSQLVSYDLITKRHEEIEKNTTEAISKYFVLDAERQEARTEPRVDIVSMTPGKAMNCFTSIHQDFAKLSQYSSFYTQMKPINTFLECLAQIMVMQYHLNPNSWFEYWKTVRDLQKLNQKITIPLVPNEDDYNDYQKLLSTIENKMALLDEYEIPFIGLSVLCSIARIQMSHPDPNSIKSIG